MSTSSASAAAPVATPAQAAPSSLWRDQASGLYHATLGDASSTHGTYEAALDWLLEQVASQPSNRLHRLRRLRDAGRALGPAGGS